MNAYTIIALICGAIGLLIGVASFISQAIYIAKHGFPPGEAPVPKAESTRV